MVEERLAERMEKMDEFFEKALKSIDPELLKISDW